MFCKKCGASIPDDSRFCPVCGAPADQNVRSTTGNTNSNAALDCKSTSIIAYITWIGFIIAMCIGDREGAKFYLNQALVFNIFCLLSYIPFIGWMWGIFMFVCFILGIMSAISQQPRELPLIGKIRILN